MTDQERAELKRLLALRSDEMAEERRQKAEAEAAERRRKNEEAKRKEAARKAKWEAERPQRLRKHIAKRPNFDGTPFTDIGGGIYWMKVPPEAIERISMYGRDFFDFEEGRDFSIDGVLCQALIGSEGTVVFYLEDVSDF